MERISCLILLLSGLCSLSSCVPKHSYVLVETPKTWYEAQSYCRENCLDLATIDDVGEMETVLTVVGDKYVTGLWTGLRAVDTKMWHWSLPDKHFYKEGERNYLIWGKETLDNCGSYRYGKFYSIACHNIFFSICFDAKKLGDEQYVLTPTKLTWMNAQNYCRKYHTDLASVRNEAENQIIQKLANGFTVWLGLYRDGLQWSDGTYSSLRYWKVGHHIHVAPGSRLCAALLKSESGRWEAQPCVEEHPFLCNCPITRVIRMRISSQDSVLEQNNPEVQDSILKQVKVCGISSFKDYETTTINSNNR
ncbi:secretory phospholipase A2 receptor-like isoform X2 [Trachinotus anak]|uniref:secretory phospholipase A2 receptor-like isoform X2 n=1 Tax=Trachinotus anak TaxID=443729 RepID=UPI0039F238DA